MEQLVRPDRDALFELAPHQVDAVRKLHNGAVLVGGVGSGKSITALAYFAQIDRMRKIVVITTAKKRDSAEWYDDAMMMSLRCELVVDSWNNIKNYVDEKDVFFIFDEQRVVGGGAWVDAFLKITKQNHWILLSATPADTWMDLVPIFIANGFYRNKTEFNNAHVRWSRFAKYPKVDGYYDTWILEKYRDAIYVEMPFLKKAIREDHIIDVDFDKMEQDEIYRQRWNAVENRPIKDAGEMMRLLRKSANSHPSRYEKVRKLCEDNPKVIVFYVHTYELEDLRLLHSDLDIPIAEWNGQNHQDIPRSDRWIYLVQYQAGSEGWNCVETDTIVFYTLPYSYRQYEQAHGRIDRLNTKFEILNYYTLKSRAIIDQGIWRALHRKKNFQVSAFVKKTWPKMQSITPLN